MLRFRRLGINNIIVYMGGRTGRCAHIQKGTSWIQNAHPSKVRNMISCRNLAAMDKSVNPV